MDGIYCRTANSYTLLHLVSSTTDLGIPGKKENLGLSRNDSIEYWMDILLKTFFNKTTIDKEFFIEW